MNNITTILQTDISAAFDTVDLDILIKKLQYYGLDRQTFGLMTLFLSDRRQYVNIDSFDSNIQLCPPCSTECGDMAFF